MVHIKPYLDKRKKKVSGRYPVKIRIWNGKASYKGTGIDLDEGEFERIYSGKRLTNELLEKKELLEALIAAINSRLQAGNQIKTIKGGFQTGRGSAQEWISSSYTISMAIDEASAKPGIKLGTRGLYKTTKKAIERFLSVHSEFEASLQRVSPEFLKQLQYFLQDEGKTVATIGIYMRTFKAVINEAILNEKFDPKNFPFGKRKYMIPSSKGTKEVLSKGEITALAQLDLDSTSLECYSRDWLVLSYLCYGMNIGDLLNLKNKDLREGGFHFIREKTRTTSLSAPAQIRVDFGSSWKQLIRDILSRQRSSKTSHNDFLFPYYHSGMDEKQRMRAKQAMIRKVNQHLPKVCKLAGITKKVSTQTARHSFASNLYQGDASIAEIQQMLGHTSPRTTENYLHSLRTDRTNKAIENLLSLED